MKIQLNNEMETMIIPLYGKARMSELGVFDDAYAEEAVDRIEYDYSGLKIQHKTQVMLAMRAMLIDDYVSDFLTANPDCMVLHLGCGLDARYMRLGSRGSLWYELDFPDVISIKEQLYESTEQFTYLPSSVTDLTWLDKISEKKPETLVIAEGLLMYLSEDEIKALMDELRLKFGSYTIVFDAFSKMTAKSAKHHPSLKRTGATVKWGVDDPGELECYTETAKYVQSMYLTDEKVLLRLPPSYKVMFKMASYMKTAREAHRVIVMNVGTK